MLGRRIRLYCIVPGTSNSLPDEGVVKHLTGIFWEKPMAKQPKFRVHTERKMDEPPAQLNLRRAPFWFVCHLFSLASFRFLAWSWCLITPHRLETYLDLCYALKGFGNPVGAHPTVGGRYLPMSKSLRVVFRSTTRLLLESEAFRFQVRSYVFRVPSFRSRRLVSEYDATVSGSGVHG